MLIIALLVLASCTITLEDLSEEALKQECDKYIFPPSCSWIPIDALETACNTCKELEQEEREEQQALVEDIIGNVTANDTV